LFTHTSLRRTRVPAVVWALGAACVLGSACQQPPRDALAASRVAPEYDQATGRLKKIAYDANGNGTPDTWAYMDGARLTRLEADENENGRLDRWEYYPATGAGARRPPERIERSTADDGRVTRTEFFQGSEMVRVEEDTDGNGAVDKWETYTDGALTVLSLDTTGDGKPDRRLLYKRDGSLDRIEVDPSGSGDFRRLAP
jgi:hypothetical protein